MSYLVLRYYAAAVAAVSCGTAAVHIHFYLSTLVLSVYCLLSNASTPVTSSGGNSSMHGEWILEDSYYVLIVLLFVYYE